MSLSNLENILPVHVSPVLKNLGTLTWSPFKPSIWNKQTKILSMKNEGKKKSGILVAKR